MDNETQTRRDVIIPWYVTVLSRVKTIFNPARMVALGFLGVILLGTLLLCLPISTRGPGGAPFITSLFTATSATCVTGLVVHDTATYWSTFGQVVILTMIQIGGLGFMSMATIFSLVLNRKIGLRQRLITLQSFNLKDISGVVRLARHIIFGTIFFEFVGAILLTIRFAPDFGFLGGLYRGVFHSISAFCNAGFDIMGTLRPDSSLALYAHDPVVLVTIMALVIVGGIGFFVWEDVYRNRSWRKLRVHSKVVITTTLILIVGGTALYWLWERGNPQTIGNTKGVQQWLEASFQAVTPRTAGFSSVPQAALTEPSKLLTIFLMFIGGSPGSTAGGIKTVTLAVLFLGPLAVIRGRTQIRVFGRGINRHLILSAFSVLMLSLLVLIPCIAIILSTQNLPLVDTVFEAVSAMGTVGLSTGVTPFLLLPGKICLMLLMFFGRIGMLSISFALLSAQKGDTRIRLPESHLIVG